MEQIVAVHYPEINQKLLEAAIVRFYELRAVSGLRKKPSTSEFIDWLFVLIRGGVSPQEVAMRIPLLGTLLKQEADLDLARKRLA